MDVEKKHFTCVICPLGCEIDVELQNGNVVSMEGSKCEKGKEFVLQELEEAMRILTTTVPIKGAKWAMLPVRTDKPIPKRLLSKVIEQLATIELHAPVKMYHVIVKDVAGTDANIVATRNMGRVNHPKDAKKDLIARKEG
jgi:CxxC motif-containing protein